MGFEQRGVSSKAMPSLLAECVDAERLSRYIASILRNISTLEYILPGSPLFRTNTVNFC